jgi:hypothetical protein
MNTTPTPREELKKIDTRKLEIEQAIFKLKREDAELEQKRIALITQNRELQMADLTDARTAEQRAQIDAITPKPKPPDFRN